MSVPANDARATSHAPVRERPPGAVGAHATRRCYAGLSGTEGVARGSVPVRQGTVDELVPRLPARHDGPIEQVGDGQDEGQEVPRRGTPDQGHRFGNRVQPRSRHDGRTELLEESRGLVHRSAATPKPYRDAQLDGEIARLGLEGAQLGQTGQVGGEETGRYGVCHGLSVPTGCHNGVDRALGW